MNFIVRWIVTAVAVGAAVWLVPGIDVLSGDSWAGIALLALVLALINLSVKPILQVLSLPVTVITLGLFYLVVNTAVLYLSAWLTNGLFNVGFEIATFGSGFVAAIVISIVSGIVNGIIGGND
ncbi:MULTISPECIES: phage holin family protein [unclassified Adlercreutzia]|uniref:phage holin family protein n=1 Tax=unclassified Adlercreutzia TaxID=2636013 RepID=UPI0013EC2317|nr:MULTISPECIES: phage holin family protein [unclassified Adlercreutzia]